MNIFKEDLLKNKYFLLLVMLFVLVTGILYLRNYNSVKIECELYAKELSQKLSVVMDGGGLVSRSRLDKITPSGIQDCIRKGGP